MTRPRSGTQPARARASARAPTRERIVDAARTLMQQRGYHGVGTAEILALAEAPKGSMYHHFPEGKERVAAEAVARIGEDVGAAIRAAESLGTTAEALIRQLARGMVRWLERTAFRESSMLASVAAGADPALPVLQAALHAALDAWRTALTTLLTREGVPQARARRLATTILAALEGALLTARIEQSGRVVRDVAEALVQLVQLARQVDQHVPEDGQ